MANRFFDFLGLVVISVIVAILAKNPSVISNFFQGFTNLSGVALKG